MTIPADNAPARPGGDTTAPTAATATTMRVPRCRDCGLTFWYPRARCPNCRSEALDQIETSGTGTLYTYSEMSAGKNAPGGATGAMLAYVELDEGPFVLTTLVGLSPDEVRIGMPLTALAPDDSEPVRFGVLPAGDGGPAQR